MKKLVVIIVILSVLFTGCQKTPDESAVVSKANGLSDDVIAKPLKDGEKQVVEAPENWKMSEKKSNDRVTISADLNLGKIEVGNLPVIEMKNHEISQQELEKLVSYFAKGETLYTHQIYTKDVYQKAIDRIEDKEGAYSDSFMQPAHQKVEEALKKAIEVAPETQTEALETEMKFQQKQDDSALIIANSYKNNGSDTEQMDEAAYFTADVGTDRAAYIEAETYTSKLENSSNFTWRNGARAVTDSFIQTLKAQKENVAKKGLDTSGYSDNLIELLSQYEACLNQDGKVEESAATEQAKQLLNDLNISNMEVSSSESALWFPMGAMSDIDAPGYGEDPYWQADLTKAEAGYQITFSTFIEGIPAKQENGVVLSQTTDSYTPPFPVETITVVVTSSGVQSFNWEGMTEKVATIAENTKLMSFDSIQSKLVDQIFYWYSMSGQPENDPTLFDYNVKSAKLEYTYIPAFGEPKDAWLVPVWTFEVTESSQGIEESGYVPYVINALDGGAIGTTY